ncbi:MAG: VWA domain-containing protein [Caldilineaceae bacterium]|nr:VWA domain-containing protein [Caldilineaceae bacterium]
MSVDGKIQALNNAIREAIPHMQMVANENPYAQVQVRAVSFSKGAQWHISQPTPVAEFRWQDLKAGGVTDMGKALTLVAEQLDEANMPARSLPPVMVLISDGQPTDNFDQGLAALMKQPWAKKSVRIAIAIGDDADVDVLQRFIGHPEFKPLQANNADSLVKYIKWASTEVLKSASSPVSQIVQDVAPVGNVPMPAIPDAGADLGSAEDVW